MLIVRWINMDELSGLIDMWIMDGWMGRWIVIMGLGRWMSICIVGCVVEYRWIDGWVDYLMVPWTNVDESMD